MIGAMTSAPPPPVGGWDAASPAQPGRPRRRMSARAKSIWLVVLCVLLVISTAGTHGGERSSFPVPLQNYAQLGGFVMIGASVLLMWRHQRPVPIALGLIILTALVPTTPLPVLIALPAATAVTVGIHRWALILGTFVATVISFVWDVASRTSYLAQLVNESAPGTSERFSLFWAVPVLAAATVAPFAATGIARRLRIERDAAQRESSAAERNVKAMHREVELERHRQELARELHDTLAARLSTLSLHAGALELTVGPDDDRAIAAARAVRESAQHSLDDLRHVVKELRNPDALADARTQLGELSALIDEALRAGTDVRAQVFVTDPAACDPRVAHAVYRMVQESISNVRRHAPGAALRIDLRGGPGAGLTLSATNALAPGAQTTGSGNGLLGMAERAELLGGTFQAGPVPESAFEVRAWLPWMPVEPPEGSAEPAASVD